MFEQAGLPHTRDIDHVPNSRNALRVSELARQQGAYEAVHERLFEAYWARAANLSDDEVLVAEATAAGLAEADVRDVIADPDRYLDVVRGSTDAALRFGASGVPAWLVADRIVIPGAQPHEVFERVLARLGHEPLDDAPAGPAPV